uniref:DNA damage-binding protein 1 n=1 Tax=Romanomermis culicivorax TaxID=13658 RepID=A0A915KQY0_ROMCU
MDSKRGRLLVLEYSNNDQSGPQFLLIHERKTQGGLRSLTEFNRKLLACIRSRVELYEWSSDINEKELHLKRRQFTFMNAYDFKTKCNTFLIGGSLFGISLLIYKPSEQSFERIRPHQLPEMTAVEIIEDDSFLSADISSNLLKFHRDENDRQHLQQIGRFPTGEMINRFRYGSLATQHHTVNSARIPVARSILFGTNSGGIGLVVRIPEKLFTFLRDLENRLLKNICSVDEIEHLSWPSVDRDDGVESVVGFVDGDLIESFLDLSGDQMSNVINGMQMVDDETSDMKRKATVDDVIKIVEGLIQMN